MAAGHIRNRGCVPYLDEEGVFTKPITTVKWKKDSCFDPSLPPYQRMFMHHTLASARRYAHFKNFENLIPEDDLDFLLSSTFNKSTEVFPDCVDVYLQPETQNVATWRRLRNTRDLTPDREQMASSLGADQDGEKKGSSKRGSASSKKGRAKKKGSVIPYRYNFAHKLLIGGVLEKKHPSSIKLMNSSHHSPQTNAGYSRQPSDGNFYQY